MTRGGRMRCREVYEGAVGLNVDEVMEEAGQGCLEEIMERMRGDLRWYRNRKGGRGLLQSYLPTCGVRREEINKYLTIKTIQQYD